MLGLDIIDTDPLHFIVWGLQVRIGNKDDRDVLTRLNFSNDCTFFVEQEGGHLNGQLRADLTCLLLHCVFFDDAQHRECQRLDATNGAMAAAAGADNLAGFTQ